MKGIRNYALVLKTRTRPLCCTLFVLASILSTTSCSTADQFFAPFWYSIMCQAGLVNKDICDESRLLDAFNELLIADDKCDYHHDQAACAEAPALELQYCEVAAERCSDYGGYWSVSEMDVTDPVTGNKTWLGGHCDRHDFGYQEIVQGYVSVVPSCLGNWAFPRNQ